MKRLLAIGIAVWGATGCHTSSPSRDPFLRTTVPPPATTQIAPPAGADPYYSGGAPPPAISPPLTPGAAPYSPPPGAVPYSPPPANGSQISPPGGFGPPAGSSSKTGPPDRSNFQQTQIDRGKASQQGAAELRVGDSSLARLSSPASKFASSAVPAATSISVARPAAQPAARSAAQPAVAAVTRPREGIELTGYRAPNRPLVTEASPGITPFEEDATGAIEPPAAASVAVASVAVANAAVVDNPSVVRIVEQSGPAELAFHETPLAPPESAGVERSVVRLSAQEPVQEITDLPPVTGQSAKLYGTRLSLGASEAANASTLAFRETSAAAASEANSTAAAMPTGSPAAESGSNSLAANSESSYAYEPSYSSLRGRLEYSQSTRQWKLRYIPIDGQTDKFGGSVVLPGSAALQSLKPGDFVRVQGRMSQTPTIRGFSPTYEPSHIEPSR